MSIRSKLAIFVIVTLTGGMGCGQDGPAPTGGPAADSAIEAPESAAPAPESPVASVLATVSASASAPDAPFWPRFHGPTGDNISTESGLLKKWPDGGPELVWTADGIGDGFSSVTTAEGRIYTAGNIEDQTVVTAVDLDGKRLWQVPNGKPWAGSTEGTRGTPTIDGDRIYHQSPLGRIACLDAADGSEIWSRNVLDEFGAKNIRWALSESLLIDGDRVISSPGGPQVSLVALDKATGKTVWKAPSTDDVTGYASPWVGECGGLRMILTMNAKAVIGVDADSGELLWRWPHETEYDVNALLPIYHNGQVFVSSGYGAGSEMLKLKVSGGKVKVDRVWQSKEMDNHHGGVILWDGYLYGSASKANRGAWICLDWNSGEMKYAEKGVRKGSLTCADGMLYTLSEKRVMGLVEPTPAEHKLVGRFDLPSGGSGPSWAHPVVVGGRLYIRHGNFLYAYNVRGS